MKLKALSLIVFASLFSNLASGELLAYKKQKDLQNQNLSHINSVYALLEYQDRSKKNNRLLLDKIQQEARNTQLREYAYTLAIKTAMQSQLGLANDEVEKISRDLDSIYNFEPLMIQGRVIPPVITEAKDLYNQESPYQIRLSGALYDVYSQAKFSSVAPNWRDYLKFPTQRNAYELMAFGATGLEPKNDYEREIWVKATEEGWEQGIIQANSVIQGAMDKLNRDYVGMVRFHTFVKTRKISMPIIKNYELYDSNMGERLVLDEQLLQIEVLPQFTNQPKLGYSYTQEAYQANNFVQGEKRALDDLTNNGKSLDNHQLIQDLKNNKGEKPFDAPHNPIPKLDESPIKIEINRTYLLTDTGEKTLNGDTVYNADKVSDAIANAEPVSIYLPAQEVSKEAVVDTSKSNKKLNFWNKGYWEQKEAQKQEKQQAKALAKQAKKQQKEQAKALKQQQEKPAIVTISEAQQEQSDTNSSQAPSE